MASTPGHEGADRRENSPASGEIRLTIIAHSHQVCVWSNARDSPQKNEFGRPRRTHDEPGPEQESSPSPGNVRRAFACCSFHQIISGWLPCEMPFTFRSGIGSVRSSRMTRMSFAKLRLQTLPSLDPWMTGSHLAKPSGVPRTGQSVSLFGASQEECAVTNAEPLLACKFFQSLRRLILWRFVARIATASADSLHIELRGDGRSPRFRCTQNLSRSVSATQGNGANTRPRGVNTAWSATRRVADTYFTATPASSKVILPNCQIPLRSPGQRKLFCWPNVNTREITNAIIETRHCSTVAVARLPDHRNDDSASALNNSSATSTIELSMHQAASPVLRPEAYRPS